LRVIELINKFIYNLTGNNLYLLNPSMWFNYQLIYLQIIRANQVHLLKWVPYLIFSPSPQDLLHLICMFIILHFSHLQVFAPFVIPSLLFSQQNYSLHYLCYRLLNIWIVGNLFCYLLFKAKES